MLPSFYRNVRSKISGKACFLEIWQSKSGNIFFGDYNRERRLHILVPNPTSCEVGVLVNCLLAEKMLKLNFSLSQNGRLKKLGELKKLIFRD
jgi:hypothetical protein